MKTKLPSYEECMRAEPCKYNLQVEVHAPTDVCEKKSHEINQNQQQKQINKSNTVVSVCPEQFGKYCWSLFRQDEIW